MPGQRLVEVIGVSLPTYEATATREGRWWVVEVHGVGTTQGRTAAEAREMAEALVTDLLELPTGGFEVALTFEVPGMDEAIAAARRATEEAATAQRRAAEDARRIAHELRERGLSAGDMAVVLRVSRSRAQQLLRSA